MSDPTLLTTATNAIWDAIDNFADTAGAFTQKYRSDEDFARMPYEGGEMVPMSWPAIAVFPVRMEPDWYVHREQKVPIEIEITIWTPEWRIYQASDLALKVRKAVWQAAPVGDQVPYVKRATGFLPDRVGPITFKRILIGDRKSVKAIETTLLVAVELRDDPLA